MKISVFGLGYVGVVASACLSEEGHYVVGVDPNATKVELVNAGRSPIIEKGVDEYIAAAVNQGRLRATSSAQDAVEATDISFVCVGTPSQINGSLDLQYLLSACEEIGAALRMKSDYHVVVIRSTILPGTMRNVVAPALESASGKRSGVEFGLCTNPEFLREGTAVYDYVNPPKTVIGESDRRAGDFLAQIYHKLSAPLFRVPIDVAEMVKYSDNVWHALKVCFANEIGTICKSLGIDSHEVMNVFCQDEKLNLSSYYLKPGFAFGGSCLPKDVRALSFRARSLDLNLPLMSAILPSNQEHVERGLRLIQSKGRKRIGVLGFSFKAGTDDLRESPIVEVIERLLGKGYDIRVYDRNVSLAKLVGSNRDFIRNHIPHISNLMVDNIEDVIAHAEVVVIGNSSEEFATLLERIDRSVEVVDLVRVARNPHSSSTYEGLCW